MQEFILKYQIHRRASPPLRGDLKTTVGEGVDSVKRKILAKERITNQSSFIVSCTQATIPVSLDSITLREKPQGEIRVSVQSTSSKGKRTNRVRTNSEDNQWQQCSFDQKNQSYDFIQDQPQQKPPLVKGFVRKQHRICSCFSTRKYLSLSPFDLHIYTDEAEQQWQRTIHIQQITYLRSFRRQDSLIVRVIIGVDEQFDFKLSNSNVGKQWMGYLMQAMRFARYLVEKQSYSREQSFQKYKHSILNEERQVIRLRDDGSELQRSLYCELPQQTILRKKNAPLIKLQQFEVRKKIGSSSFSVVYLAERDGKLYALKQLNKDKLLHKNHMKYAITELNVLVRSRQCPYIVPLHFAFQTRDCLYLALQYVPTGNLGTYKTKQDELIKRRRRIFPEQALLIITELVVAIQFLHARDILYRDLKPENILIDRNGHLFLTDFGLSKINEQNGQGLATSFLGTPLYLAPERFLQVGGGIDYQSDVYGVGLILYEMLHGETYVKGESFQSVIYKIKNQKAELDDTLPEEFKDFLKKTLEKNPSKRIKRMSEHTIFAKTDWKKVEAKQHRGIAVDWSGQNGVQIDYRIDEDYNELNFPQWKIAGWNYPS